MATNSCSICGTSLKWTAPYPGEVCRACDARAVDACGRPALYPVVPPRAEGAIAMLDPADSNPVYVDGAKCWRRYRFGGHVTMRDSWDCTTLEEFHERAFGR